MGRERMAAMDAPLVEAMLNDREPTAPLDDFRRVYSRDDNWWWVIGCGHHQNLFEAAVDRLEEADQRIRAALALCDQLIAERSTAGVGTVVNRIRAALAETSTI